MGKLLLICVLVVLCTGIVSGQVAEPVSGKYPVSNLRSRYLKVLPGKTTLDSLSLVPGSMHMPGIADSTYEVDWLNGTLTWFSVPPLDSVRVTYRVFSMKLNARRQQMNFDSLLNRAVSQHTIQALTNTVSEPDFFNFGNITYNGSFGRGISFGNAQDAVVSSNLNLQISGYLADSIEIAAAITDNNIPVQPDGTTQQLNEFDRIFLQFKKKGWQLSLGDIDIRQNRNYFLNFYKRLQGGAFENTSQISPGILNRTLVSGSIAKGKFTRNIFNGIEGNQGPYRLTGANNELYFVVLAGTERVYIDGELLQRGEDMDYVINYNTAEITFTPRRMINKDRRIQVEFEYADRNYLNTNLYLSNETDFGKRFRFRMGVFSNNDAKNSPINQSLDAKQKQFLGLIGDSVQKAFYPVASIDSFSADKILYMKIPNPVDPAADSIYVYSTNPDSARYNLSFIDVGDGNGNYIPDLNAANGKVYKWIEPLNGRPQGRYEAATFLVTPKRQQVLTFGGDYFISGKTSISADIGMSNYDINSFSHRNKGNDRGFAGRVQAKHIEKISSKLKIQGDGSLEWVEHTFRPVERLRNVEFTRDWGLPLVVQPADETIYTAGLELADEKENRLRYQVTGYNRNDNFNGIRNSLSHQQAVSGWKFNNIISITKSSSLADKGNFFRPSIDIAKTLPSLRNYTLGFNYALEHNEARNKATDTLTPYSFSFDVVKFYLKSDEEKTNKWSVSYYTRSDQVPMGKSLVRTDRSQNFTATAELMSNEAHQVRLNATYRTLQVYQKTALNTGSDKSLLGRIEYMINEWNGAVTGNLLYELGSGQEQKRDFAFLEVPAGQGEYTWFDYNNDGVQQLNEFEIALFQDQAKFIRIFTPTNEFVKAAYNSFNYSLGFNPRSLFDQATVKGMRKFISRINLQSSLQLFKKEISDGMAQFNPFSDALNDSSLISLANIWVNSVSFNKFSPKWGFDVSNARNKGKVLLTYGLESRLLTEWTMRTRWNMSRRITLELVGRDGSNGLVSGNEKFENKNYQVEQYSLEPRLTFTRGATFRIIGSYKYSNKENTQGAKEKYSSNAFAADAKYNILQSASVQGKFTYSAIRFPYETNNTVSYIMLDGLRPGKNLLWSLDLTKRLGKNLEVNIQYEGRKPGETRVIHVGRAALRAIL
ncbi:hypothetical protein [Flavihumibacter solisilvae]|uniref:Uncharacterized protein n=1 Tax=Flavihumibacter solisilvae TaxID=1349421 RepID=A0A0C1L5Y0_9BACT|nr:hypothetical protein [Flavihumibacter solisilvae]KIC94946.1 hypothetical protein OI18_08585 [Flavihumibacter solisilvae]